MRRTKIVCTIGPATQTAQAIERLVESGMNMARLNFSHGTHEQHAKNIADVRQISDKLGVSIAVLQDLPGPKLRTGPMPEEVNISTGDRFIFTTRNIQGNAEETNLPYPELVEQASLGQEIFVDDGQLEFKVESKTDTDIITRVVIGGSLGANKGINMPGTDIKLPSVTEQDLFDLEFGLAQDVDWVAVSFVRKAGDLQPIRDAVNSSGKPTLIMAKIEKREAVEDIDAIIEAADGIMIARGDLGVEMPIEKVPTIQKMIIQKCNQAGKPVITATQMLDSMIRNRRPTRAEVTDVANAIFDGSDAVMLSGETAIGKFPIETVRMMAKIAVHAESSTNTRQLWKEQTCCPSKSVTAAIAQSTVIIAHDLDAAAIVTPTSSGTTARAVSKYRPDVPIVAAAYKISAYRQLALSWGVYPSLVAPNENTDEMIEEAVREATKAGLVKEGDTVVLTAGVPAGGPGKTNLIKVHVIGETVTSMGVTTA